MAANMYDQAALALFMNTYAPINFGELFRIGAAQKEDIDRAAQQFGSQLQKFGEFRSPSVVDTENYYNMTTGRQDFLDAINKMVSNPDWMKDAANRGSLLSLINSVDYAALSQLKESADYLRMGLQTRAKMLAEGRYNLNWDKSDIANYDTLGLGRVFEDITPVAYMNLNELSTPYFNDLKPGFLGFDYQNGVRYMVSGNNEEDLFAVANAKFNDLIQTPLGQKYFEEYLTLNNGDADAAKLQFIAAVAQSLIDRTRRPNYEIDPGYVEQMRLATKRASGSGKELTGVLPDLSTILATTSIQHNVATLGGLSPEERSLVNSGTADINVYRKASLNIGNNLKRVYNAVLKNNGLGAASREVLDIVSLPLSLEIDQELLKEGGGSMIGADTKVTNSTRAMTLGPDMSYALLGFANSTNFAVDRMNNQLDKKRKELWLNRAKSMATIQQAWYNDQFRDVIVKGDGKVMSDLDETYHRRKVYIPVELLRKIGFNSIKDGDFSYIIGGKMVKIGDVLDEDQLTITLDRDDDGEVRKGGTTVTSKRKKIDKSDLYMEFDATYPLLIGNNEATLTRNAKYEKSQRGFGTSERFSQAANSTNKYLGYGE